MAPGNRFFSVFLLLAALMASGKAVRTPSSGAVASMEQLRSCMSGTFSSKQQSIDDPSYYHIVLRMEPVEFLNRRSGKGFFLYVEQAMSTSPSEPYRQRIYHVEQLSDTLFASWIYLLPDVKRFAGKKGDDPLFQQIADSLLIKEGCEVLLRPQSDGSFAGGTVGRNCASDRSGATWTSSEVTLYPDRMISWDRGWNDAGEQKWGAVKGGYIFIKEP